MIIILEAFTAEELIYLLSDRFKEAEDTDEIQSAFKLFVSDLISFIIIVTLQDTDGKGFITVNDLRRISNELGENLGDDELKVSFSYLQITIFLILGNDQHRRPIKERPC